MRLEPAKRAKRPQKRRSAFLNGHQSHSRKKNGAAASGQDYVVDSMQNLSCNRVMPLLWWCFLPAKYSRFQNCHSLLSNLSLTASRVLFSNPPPLRQAAGSMDFRCIRAAREIFAPLLLQNRLFGCQDNHGRQWSDGRREE